MLIGDIVLTEGRGGFGKNKKYSEKAELFSGNKRLNNCKT
jgi:hypothetical protein